MLAKKDAKNGRVLYVESRRGCERMQCSYKAEVETERMKRRERYGVFHMIVYHNINFFSNAFADDCIPLQPSTVLYTIKHGLLGNAPENCHPLER